MSLDTLYHVNTPEGISLRLSPAGPVPRMMAWMIDILIRIGFNIVMFSILGIMGNTGMGIGLIISFLMEWFYPVYFELYKNGQTPGKKAFNLYVTMENASPITPAASVIRNLLRFVDFLPFFYGFGFVSMMISNRFQRLGDLVASTVVLHQTLEHNVLDEIKADPITPPVSLKLNEQQALIRFYQRRPYLTDERADELATLTGPLLDKDEPAPASRLMGLSSWIMGNR
jgi:uncharacterized RDD family membrane protein YckC